MTGLGSPTGRSTSWPSTEVPYGLVRDPGRSLSSRPSSSPPVGTTLTGTRARTRVVGPTPTPRACSQVRSAPARTARTTSLTVGRTDGPAVPAVLAVGRRAAGGRPGTGGCRTHGRGPGGDGVRTVPPRHPAEVGEREGGRREQALLGQVDVERAAGGAPDHREPAEDPDRAARGALDVAHGPADGLDRLGRSLGRLEQGPGDEVDGGGLRPGPPRVRRGLAGVGVGVEDDLGQVEPVDAVDQRLVGLADDGEPVALQALHDVQLPQRPAAVQLARVDPGHELAQLVEAARAGQGEPADVEAEVEAGVVDPHGAGQAARDLADALAVAGHEGDPARQVPLQAGVVDGALEDHHRADVLGDALLLGVQERGVQSAQAVGHPRDATQPRALVTRW